MLKPENRNLPPFGNAPLSAISDSYLNVHGSRPAQAPSRADHPPPVARTSGLQFIPICIQPATPTPHGHTDTYARGDYTQAYYQGFNRPIAIVGIPPEDLFNPIHKDFLLLGICVGYLGLNMKRVRTRQVLFRRFIMTALHLASSSGNGRLEMTVIARLRVRVATQVNL